MELFKLVVLLEVFLFRNDAVEGNNIDFQYISEYFSYKRITLVDFILCNEKDGITLRRIKHPRLLSGTYIKKNINWDTHPYLQTQSGFFIDLRCPQNVINFKKVPIFFFTDRFTWLVSGEFELSLNLISASPIGLSTDLVLLLPNRTLLSFYKIHPTLELRKEDCKVDGQIPKCPDKKSRFNLDGFKINSTAVNFLRLTNNEEGIRQYHTLAQNKTFRPESELFVRMFYVLNQVLKSMYNYSINVELTNSFGYKSPNGSFDGMIREIQLKKAEFGVTSMAILPERLEEVDFTVSFDVLYFIIVFMEERSFGGATALAKPFSLEVWLMLALISITALFASIIIIQRYYPQNICSQALLNVIGVLSAQGTLDINRTSARIMNFFLLALGLLLAAYYNASIMNGLLSPVPTTIKNIPDLFNSKAIGIGKITYMTPRFFHPALKEMFLKKRVSYIDIPAGVAHMRRENYALVGDGNSMYLEIAEQMTGSEVCSQREIEMAKPFPTASPVAKNSHYREMLKLGLSRLLETGVVDREKKFWYPEKPACLGATVFKPVSWKAITIAFYIYAAGVITSSIFFLLEMREGSRRQPSIRAFQPILNRDFRNRPLLNY